MSDRSEHWVVNYVNGAYWARSARTTVVAFSLSEVIESCADVIEGRIDSRRRGIRA